MLLIVPEYKLWFKVPPLGLLYIASVLKKNSTSVDFIDAVVSKNFYKEIDLKISKHKYVGLTVNVSHAYSAKKISSYIRTKYPDKKIIWGGPYSTALYEKLLPEFADIIVIGEGETQIVNIVNDIPLNKIKGIAYYDKKIILNERENYISQLDTIPYPSWELIDSSLYLSPGKNPSYIMISERGCPYKCINCFKQIHGDRYRTRDSIKVVDEIELLVNKFHAKEISFWDDNFTLIPKRAKEICREIIKRKLYKKVRFALPNGIRADINDPELFDLMRDAGFYYVSVAIESADQQVLDKLGKRLNIDEVRATVENLYKRGFRIGLFFMMGLPFDTEQSLKKTAEFASSLPAHHVFIFIVTPFHGTKLYEMAKDAGKFVTDYDEDYINYDKVKQRFINESLSYETVLKHHRMAYRMFYLNFTRMFRILKALWREKMGFKEFIFFVKSGMKIIFTGHR